MDEGRGFDPLIPSAIIPAVHTILTVIVQVPIGFFGRDKINQLEQFQRVCEREPNAYTQEENPGDPASPAFQCLYIFKGFAN